MAIKQLALIEPLSGGHHGTYLAWLTQGAIESGSNPQIITTQESIDSEDFRLNLNDSVRRHSIGALPLYPDSTPKFLKQFVVRKRAARWLGKAIDSIDQKSDVLLPYMDLFSHQIAVNYNLLGSHSWSGISMAAKFHHNECLRGKNPSAKDKLEKFLFLRLLSHPKLLSIFCLDPLLPEYVARTNPMAGRKLIYLPDPADPYQMHDKFIARQKLGIPVEKFVVLCYGSLDPRKGCIELAESSMQAQFPENALVILAGKFTTAARNLMESNIFASSVQLKKVIVDDRFMTPEDESLLFSAADLVWLGYTNFYQMSGVFTRSLAYEVPVLGTAAGLIGWHISQTGAGFTLPEISPTKIAFTINRLSQDSTLMQTARLATLDSKQNFSIAKAKSIVFNS